LRNLHHESGWEWREKGRQQRGSRYSAAVDEGREIHLLSIVQESRFLVRLPDLRCQARRFCELSAGTSPTKRPGISTGPISLLSAHRALGGHLLIRLAERWRHNHVIGVTEKRGLVGGHEIRAKEIVIELQRVATDQACSPVESPEFWVRCRELRALVHHPGTEKLPISLVLDDRIGETCGHRISQTGLRERTDADHAEMPA